MYEDKTLVCKECGKEFVFTAGEQEFYAERGFQNEPQRCKACRDARKNATRGPREYYTATCAACDEVYRIKHIDRGIFAEGLGCVISAFFGGLPCTSYTQNIGIISATGVCSRRVTQIAGVIFLAYGLCPKLAYILSGIPRSVIGAVFLISAATIMFSGIDSIISDKRSLRNTLVAGTTLALAIMLPYHCASTYSAWAKSLPAFLNMLCTSTVFIAVVAGVLLNLILNYVLKDKNEK